MAVPEERFMDPASFKAIQPLLDDIAKLSDRQLGMPELHRVLSDLTRLLGKGITVSVNVSVDVFDEAKERSLPLLTTGISAGVDKEPYRIRGDSTPQRYVVEEGIQVVPHDRCPNCWEVWDFKLQNPVCQHCGTTLGDTCKLLLDTDKCPWCEEGKVNEYQASLCQVRLRSRSEKRGLGVNLQFQEWNRRAEIWL
jgi:hypothetical protein